ncbi:MAG: DUF1064 domain-containing protein [Endomicrobium sp.]|jgi:hypothetical protein|nr:DUF1064 domain-containing protein [Endomicrobium sp.]
MIRLPKKSKFSSQKTVVGNIKFASKKEAERYKELKLMEKAGVIEDLKLQPNFLIQEKFIHEKRVQREVRYIADFMYYDTHTEKTVVEDVKGFRTKTYIVKKKMFLKRYGDQYKFVEI